ncbi:MAG TPA: alpha/beta hydrolase [Pseudomonadota bacterium]|nr:alpha/beta hydrolase [Pseudomonadota bacterium]
MSSAPLYFAGSKGAIFGWYHPPGGPAVRSCGVVLCPSLGIELILGHRALRHIALRLAAAGFPVLRFDYHGTGDSAGDEREPERVNTWRADLQAAADELRRRSGVSEISFFGLRIGATMSAVEAAQRGGAGSLVLWDPCLNGRSFVREMRVFAHMAQGSEAGGALDAAGFMLTAATQGDLAALDLLSLARAPAPHVLIISTGQRPVAPRLALHLGALGAAVRQRHLPDSFCLLTEPHLNTIPGLVIDAAVAFLKEVHPPRASLRAVLPPRLEERVGHTPLREEAVRFGPDERLFGILTEPPPAAARPALPPILLLNAGCIHHVGPNRWYVSLARQLAQLGHRVLRFDLSGLGDSQTTPGCIENLMYPEDALHCVRAAMSMLATRHGPGSGRFILAGLCSGATVAFQAGLLDPRVVGLIMLNTAEFYFDHRADCTYSAEDFAARRYLRTLLWQRPQLRQGARVMAAKARAVARRALQRLRGRATPVDVAADVRRLCQRRTELLLVFAEDDVGRESLELHLGRSLRRPGGLPGVHLAVVRNATHTFSSAESQRRTLQILTAHLRALYGSGAAW